MNTLEHIITRHILLTKGGPLLSPKSLSALGELAAAQKLLGVVYPTLDEKAPCAALKRQLASVGLELYAAEATQIVPLFVSRGRLTALLIPDASPEALKKLRCMAHGSLENWAETSLVVAQGHAAELLYPNLCNESIYAQETLAEVQLARRLGSASPSLTLHSIQLKFLAQETKKTNTSALEIEALGV